MERDKITEALDHCRRNRTDPDYDCSQHGCQNCAYNELGGFETVALTCAPLLEDAYQEMLLSADRIFGIPRDHIDQVLDYYQFHQERIDVCIEECSELIKALTKNLRAHGWPERVRVSVAESRKMIVEELTDVLICCGMLQRMYDISQDEIDAVVKRKDDRITTERHGGIYEIPKHVKDEDGNVVISPEWTGSVKRKDDEFSKSTS